MIRALWLGSALFLTACGNAATNTDAADTNSIAEAPSAGHVTDATKRANASLAARLPLTNPQDFEDASRGFLAAISASSILDDNGNSVWDISQYDFVTGDAPDTVNPSRAEMLA